MLSTQQWKGIDPATFELMALEHVQDLYPDYQWSPTPRSHDGGADARGQSLDSAIRDLYLMEAKHHPAARSMGKYTLDTHLVSAYFIRGKVRRLHVVTSGSLSDPFLLRATTFAQDFNFTFSFSDATTLCFWLSTRPESARRFLAAVPDYERCLQEGDALSANSSGIFARATILPEEDGIRNDALPTAHLVPGRKYVCIVSITLARPLTPNILPLTVSWAADPKCVSVLLPEFSPKQPVSINELHSFVLAIPFRFLQYGKNLPDIIMSSVSGEEIAHCTLPLVRQIVSLASPLVGQRARDHLVHLKRVLVDDVASARPRLIEVLGPAGSGKSRLVEELRDDAQKLSFIVKKIQFSQDPIAQQEKWLSLFRWIFFLDHNPFGISEEQLLDRSLAPDEDDEEIDYATRVALRAYLEHGKGDETLLSLDSGLRMTRLLARALRRRLVRPALICLEDVHHLTETSLAPLQLLKILMEAFDLPIGLVVTARNDETVRHLAFRRFSDALDLSDTRTHCKLSVENLTKSDAQDFIVSTLRIPELDVLSARTCESIIDRCGTNPFSLMQMLNYLTFDRGVVSSGDLFNYWTDTSALKEALRGAPKSIENLLNRRFLYLDQRGERRLVEVMAAIAVWGREMPLSVLRRALSSPLRKSELQRLALLGFTAQDTGQSVILAHDILAETLLQRSEMRAAARRLAGIIIKGQIKSVSEEHQALIFMRAGAQFFPRSWTCALDSTYKAQASEDHQRILISSGVLRKIASHSARRFNFSRELMVIEATAHQHCGNTGTSLRIFEEAREDAKRSLATDPQALHSYLESMVQVSNQLFLRLSLSRARSEVSEVLGILYDSCVEMDHLRKVHLLCFAHNRLGAILHMAGRTKEAEENYLQSLGLAESVGHPYMESHNLSDLSALYRFLDATQSRAYLDRAKEVWAKHLRKMERRRVMLECCDLFGQAMNNRSQLSKPRLYSLAVDAASRGYNIQAASALLCFACCCLVDGNLREAHGALLKVMDISTVFEDERARLYALHYLAVTSLHLDSVNLASHWNDLALQLSGDNLFKGSLLIRVLENNRVAIGGAVNSLKEEPGLLRVGGVHCLLFDRS